MEELVGSTDITHLQDQVERLDAVRTRIAALKEQEKTLVAEIRAGMGQHQIGLVAGDDAIRLDARTNSHLDREQVRALIGEEAYGTVTRLTPYVAVKVLGRFRASGK